MSRALRLSRRTCRRFHPATQHFCHTPGLGNAAPGKMRGLGIEDLADGAHARIIKMFWERTQERPRFLIFVRAEFHPGVDVWADQPRPDGSLVIGGIAVF